MPAPIPTPEDFVADFPQFQGCYDDDQGAFILRKLTDAARRTNQKVYQSPELCTQAVKLRTAILLLRSPQAERMRLEDPEQIFTWEFELAQLQQSSTMGLRTF